MLIWKPNLTLIKDKTVVHKETATFEEVIDYIMYGEYEKVVVNARAYSQIDMAIYYLIGQKKNVHIEELDNSDVVDLSDII